MLLAIVVLGSAGQVQAAPPGNAAQTAGRQADAYAGLDDPDPAVRAKTVQAIREAKDRKAVPALIAHLEDPDQQTGLYIAQALVELATRDQLTQLLLPVERANADGRWRAAYVLGQRRDVRAIPALARALNDPEVLVARTAVEALANIGGQSAVYALMESLESTRASKVHAAMWGLLTLGDAAIPALADALESDDRNLRRIASTVLEEMDTPAARKALADARQRRG